MSAHVRLGVSAGLTTACLAFVATLVAPIPLPWYLPEARGWSWGMRPETLGMDFYGRALFAAAAGILALGMVALTRRLGLQEARAAALAESAGGFSLVSLWVAAWVITYSLATREILPP